MCPLPSSPTLTDCAAIPGVVEEITCAPETIPGYYDRLFVRDIPFEDTDTSSDFAAAIDNSGTATGDMRMIEIFDYKVEPGDIPVDTVEGGRQVPAGKAPVKHTFRMSNYANYESFIRKLGHNKPMYFWLGNNSKIMGGETNWQDGMSATLAVKPIMDGKGTVTKWEFSFSAESQFLHEYVDTPSSIYNS